MRCTILTVWWTVQASVAGALDTAVVSSTLQTIFGFLEQHHPSHYEECLAAVKALLSSQLGLSLRWHNRTAQASILVILLRVPALQHVEHLDDLVAPLLSTVEQSWQVGVFFFCCCFFLLFFFCFLCVCGFRAVLCTCVCF